MRLFKCRIRVSTISIAPSMWEFAVSRASCSAASSSLDPYPSSTNALAKCSAASAGVTCDKSRPIFDATSCMTECSASLGRTLSEELAAALGGGGPTSSDSSRIATPSMRRSAHGVAHANLCMNNPGQRVSLPCISYQVVKTSSADKKQRGRRTVNSNIPSWTMTSQQAVCPEARQTSTTIQAASGSRPMLKAVPKDASGCTLCHQAAIGAAQT